MAVLFTSKSRREPLGSITSLFPYFLSLNCWLQRNLMQSKDLAAKDSILLPGGQTELIHVPVNLSERLLETTEEIRSTWQRECYEFLETQPKFCTSFAAGRRWALVIRDLWKTSLGSVGYYLTPEEELSWRKSLFAWAHGSSRLPSCCCRAVTIRKLPRSSKWPDARSRHTSIVSSCDLESTAVSSV
jgi:hypothetical protein